MADLASSISDAKTPLSLASSLWRPPSQTPCHLRSDCAVSEIFELDFGFYKTKDPLRLLVISDPTALSMRFFNWILASGIFEIRVGFREKEGKRESLMKKGLLHLDAQANPPRPRSARKKPRSWRRLPRGSPRPADWRIWRRRISLSSLFSLSLFFRIRSLSLSPPSTSRLTLTEIQDVEGVELCGTLKNVVAIAAGFVDGLEMGNNTKAAIMRIGLREMKAFSKMLFSSIEMARGSSKKGAMLPPRPPMR
ncbi:uncharacterized protein LOC126590257 [Malus sylvestris]|uniref:uncharacterized protein LOC126590257 n=1 Tax=Malus sylvestris TaxID=3752 RepID=UPI0021ABFD2B|nr:uncharacterized protein LOC126590257 [Malus sylvestris]